MSIIRRTNLLPFLRNILKPLFLYSFHDLIQSISIRTNKTSSREVLPKPIGVPYPRTENCRHLQRNMTASWRDQRFLFYGENIRQHDRIHFVSIWTPSRVMIIGKHAHSRNYYSWRISLSGVSTVIRTEKEWSWEKHSIPPINIKTARQISIFRQAYIQGFNPFYERYRDCWCLCWSKI